MGGPPGVTCDAAPGGGSMPCGDGGTSLGTVPPSDAPGADSTGAGGMTWGVCGWAGAEGCGPGMGGGTIVGTPCAAANNDSETMIRNTPQVTARCSPGPN
jgi:hypothetical protein